MIVVTILFVLVWKVFAARTRVHEADYADGFVSVFRGGLARA